jgi:hypothetical protein
VSLQPDPVGHVQAGRLARVLHLPDDVPRPALGLELVVHLGVEDDEAAAGEHRDRACPASPATTVSSVYSPSCRGRRRR